MNISKKIPSSLTSRLDEDYFLLHPVLKEKDKKKIFSMKNMKKMTLAFSLPTSFKLAWHARIGLKKNESADINI